MRINNNQHPLDPRKCNIAIDANALNKDGRANDSLVDRLLNLSAEGKIKLIVPKGVRLETLDRRAPGYVRAAVTPMIFTNPVSLNSEEQQRKRSIERELQGNAKPGKHAADADHLFEADKYCAYFVTHDQRILNKDRNIRKLLSPSLTIVTLEEFLQIFDSYEMGHLGGA